MAKKSKLFYNFKKSMHLNLVFELIPEMLDLLLDAINVIQSITPLDDNENVSMSVYKVPSS
jgi:hypothetical protein